MIRRHSKKRNLAVLPVIALTCASLVGCELLVDFDRTLIDAGSLSGVDGSFDGSETFDASNDSPSDVNVSDSAADDSSTDDAGDDAD